VDSCRILFLFLFFALFMWPMVHSALCLRSGEYDRRRVFFHFMGHGGECYCLYLLSMPLRNGTKGIMIGFMVHEESKAELVERTTFSVNAQTFIAGGGCASRRGTTRWTLLRLRHNSFS
jgi:hypothetical protein